MSLQTWKAEFYPQTASALARTKGVTAIQLLDHSIVKWTGALPANTKKHGVVYDAQWCTVKTVDHQLGYHEDPKNELVFDSTTCSLCRKYDGPRSNGLCTRCPLAQVRGGLRCYDFTFDQAAVYRMGASPENMVKALKAAKQMVLKQVR